MTASEWVEGTIREKRQFDWNEVVCSLTAILFTSWSGLHGLRARTTQQLMHNHAFHIFEVTWSVEDSTFAYLHQQPSKMVLIFSSQNKAINYQKSHMLDSIEIK